MSADRDIQQNDLSEETRKSGEMNSLEFDIWASQVRRQMLASLKRRTFVYGDFWGNNTRANRAKAEAQEEKPED